MAILMTMIAGSLAKFVLEAVLSEPDPSCEYLRSRCGGCVIGNVENMALIAVWRRVAGSDEPVLENGCSHRRMRGARTASIVLTHQHQTLPCTEPPCTCCTKRSTHVPHLRGTTVRGSSRVWAATPKRSSS